MSANPLRDYVTRSAFDLSLTRNQIATIEAIAHALAWEKVNGRPPPTAVEAGLPEYPSHAIVALKKMERIGLLVHEDPSTMRPAWSRYPYRLTAAGETVWSLLVEAELVRKPTIRRRAA